MGSKLRTWIALDRRALRHNYQTLRKLIGPRVRLWAVVKSNAYGHGLFVFSKLLEKLGVDGFCVDSVLEGLALRREGIRKPILVLGPTLSTLFREAAARRLTITVSTLENLRALGRLSKLPEFHLKFDTGMHRQGFYSEAVPLILRELARWPFVRRKKLTGVYTHFASATSRHSPYTERQFQTLQKIRAELRTAGFSDLVFHAAATGGTLMHPKFHLDAVRVGKGLYGFFPTERLARELPRVLFQPVLRWQTLVTEIKYLKTGDRVGYDLTEAVRRPTAMAILPVGYWHGLPRSLSSVGKVLIRGRLAKILGRVSMDLTAVDVTGIPVRVGDVATLIGRAGRQELHAQQVARQAGTIAYELLTRLNPLIEKVVI